MTLMILRTLSAWGSHVITTLMLASSIYTMQKQTLLAISKVKYFEIATTNTPNVIKLQAVDRLLIFKLPTLEEFTESFPFEKNGIRKQSISLFYYLKVASLIDDTVDKTRSLLHVISDRTEEDKGDPFHTTWNNSLRFCDSQNRIIFNSIPELIYTLFRYEQFALHEASKDKNFNSAPALNRAESDYLSKFGYGDDLKLRMHNNSIASHFDEWCYYHKINVDTAKDNCNTQLQIKSYLSGGTETEAAKVPKIDILVNSFPSPDNWEEDPETTAEKFKEIYIEACHQIYGLIPENFEHALDGLVLANEKYWIKGEDLGYFLSTACEHSQENLEILRSELQDKLRSKLLTPNPSYKKLDNAEDQIGSKLHFRTRDIECVAEDNFKKTANPFYERISEGYSTIGSPLIIDQHITIVAGPHRFPCKGEKIIRLNSIDQLRYELHFYEKDYPPPTDPKDLEAYHSKKSQHFIKLCANILLELKDRGVLKNSDPLNTSALGDLRLCDTSGYIVFENFGNFITNASRATILINDEWEVGRHKRFRANYQWNPLYFLRKIADIANFSVVKTPADNILQEIICADKSIAPHIPDPQQGVTSFTLHSASLNLRDFKRDPIIASRKIVWDIEEQLYGLKNTGLNYTDDAIQITVSSPDGRILFLLKQLFRLADLQRDRSKSEERWNRALFKPQSKTEQQVESARRNSHYYFKRRITVNVTSSKARQPQQKPPAHILEAQELFKTLEVSPRVLFAALCAMGLEKDGRKTYRIFRDNLIAQKAIQIDQESDPKKLIQKPKQPALKQVERLLEIAITANPKLNTIDELVRSSLVDLLKQICYRQYEGDPKKILDEIQSYKRQKPISENKTTQQKINQLFEAVCPELIELFEKLSQFQDPSSIKLELLPQQREAIIAINSARPIVLFGPGTGKTTTVAAASEYLNYQHALWCTNDANRFGTAQELNSKILRDKTVGIINAETRKLPTHEFEAFLKKHNYVVVGYRALSLLAEKNPQNYAILQEFYKNKIKILDEAHLLDNKKSHRSLSVQALDTKQTIVATGTPFQHRPERIATILHIALPHVFKKEQISSLTAEFKKDPALARSSLHGYATVYSVSDLAKRFISPDKVSFKEQLAQGVPCIPTLIPKVTNYELTPEQANSYIELLTDQQSWRKRHPEFARNRYSKEIALQRILLNPQKLGLGEPLGLVNKAKELALDTMVDGKKVLIFGFRRHPLRILSSYEDILKHGATLLDGSVDPEKRNSEISRLETDPNLKCGIAQINASGTGSNYRSIDRQIYCDLPPLSSQIAQACGRSVRLLFAGDERFAREEVQAIFLNPVIPQSVLEAIKDPHLKARLERGTEYSERLRRKLVQVANFDNFTSRNNADETPLSNPITTIARDLADQIDRLSEADVTEAKLAKGRILVVGPYAHAVKNAWRNEVLEKFVSSHLDKLKKQKSELRVALLPGPENLEVPIYLRHGIQAKRIYAFEAGSRVRKELVRITAEREGFNAITASVEESLPKFKKEIDIISMDPDGYVTRDIFNMFANAPIASRTLVLKNSMAQRESGSGSSLLRLVGGDRTKVDGLMLKLCGSARQVENLHRSYEDLPNLAIRGRVAAKELAEKIGGNTGCNPEELAECIWELYFQSPHIVEMEQVRYVSEKGAPFLSSFALLEKWDPNVISSQLSKHLTDLMRKRLSSTELTDTNQLIDFSILTPDETKKLLDYYTQKVRKEFRFPNIGNNPIVEIRID